MVLTSEVQRHVGHVLSPVILGVGADRCAEILSARTDGDLLGTHGHAQGAR